TLEVSDPSGGGAVAQYNVSFRDQLAPGVAYVAGSTTPSSAGDPTISTDSSTGAQTLVWVNIFDLAPNGTNSISFEVKPDNATWPVDSPFDDTATAYGSTDPRVIPAFTGTGDPVADDAVLPTAPSSAATTVTALDITKDESSPDGKLLRGVHRETTVYTL